MLVGSPRVESLQQRLVWAPSSQGCGCRHSGWGRVGVNVQNLPYPLWYCDFNNNKKNTDLVFNPVPGTERQNPLEFPHQRE